jgi:hypothetical protein
VDGSVRFLADSLSPRLFEAMATIAGLMSEPEALAKGFPPLR